MSSMLPNNVISREAKKVKFESELAQIREGDCLPSGFQSNLPDRLHLKFKPHDVTDLLRLWNSWNDEMKGKFNAKYGDIALLLSVKHSYVSHIWVVTWFIIMALSPDIARS
ncbi:hypothetical protein REPUB_Repub07fG0038300 [Reevesia pubescens]